MRLVWPSAAAALAAAVLAAALFFGPKDPQVAQELYTLQQQEIVGPEEALQRFARVLRHPTVATAAAPNHVADAEPFRALHATLERDYAAVFQALKVEKASPAPAAAGLGARPRNAARRRPPARRFSLFVWAQVNEHSLLLTWPGSDPLLRPVLLASHLDVVPASQGNWTHPPFAAARAGGFLWGRGALDTKVTLAAILEAAAQLLAAGFAPRRTLLLAFGHDEEVGGERGAGAVAALLAARLGAAGQELEVVLDEGGLILEDGLRVGGAALVPGPLALVGTAEKGLQNWRVTLAGAGGHASVPPAGDGTSVAARLARVLARLESVQKESRLVPPVTDFLRGAAPGAAAAPLRALLAAAAHPLVNPALAQAMAQWGGTELAAMVRTTVAVVGVHAGGGAHNVLPASARIDLNVRTLPGDDEAAVRRYLGVVLGEDAAHARVDPLPGCGAVPASPVSPPRGPHFDLLERAILETLAPGTGAPRPMPVVPYLLTGMTDSRWFARLAPGRVYRFGPIRADRSRGDLARVHGVDERVREGDYLAAVRFFMRFAQLSAG
jgi:carboxypeptidase PM20D1